MLCPLLHAALCITCSAQSDLCPFPVNLPTACVHAGDGEAQGEPSFNAVCWLKPAIVLRALQRGYAVMMAGGPQETLHAYAELGWLAGWLAGRPAGR
jgi:hypothetical protein